MLYKNVDTKKLQDLIYSKFSNYQDFINACIIKGYKPSLPTVKSWFVKNKDGARSPSIKNLHIIAGILGVEMEELLINSGFSKKKKNIIKIPVFEMPAGCGSSGVFDPSFNTIKEIEIPKNLIGLIYPDSSFLRIFKCFGDSMEPEYSENDYIIVDMVNGRNFIKIDGIYIFRFYDEIFIKRITFSPKEIKAKSINPKYDDIIITQDEFENFEILGKLCAKISFSQGLLLDNNKIS